MKHDDPAAGRSGGGSGGGDELGEHSGSDGEEVQGRRRGAREQLRELRDGGVGGSGYGVPKLGGGGASSATVVGVAVGLGAAANGIGQYRDGVRWRGGWSWLPCFGLYIFFVTHISLSYGKI